jgi:integrase
MRRPPKFVHGFVDRHGKARFYFRRPGFKQVPLPGLPWSPEFMQVYGTAMGGAALDIGARRTHPGSINALVVTYFKSAKWELLSPDTKRTRCRIIERFRVQHGDKRVANLREDHIRKMLEGMSGLSAKRQWLSAIRALLEAAVPSMRPDNPTAGIGNIRMPPSRGHHSWTDEEIEQYRTYWPLGTQQRLVMEFALETCSRRGEIVRLGPQHVKNGRIHIQRIHGSRDVDILMSPELHTACEAMPKAHLTYIVTARGKPRSKAGLSISFAQWATEAGLPAHCRMHGLKKGGMRRFAETGSTAHELMAISGHKTLSEVQRYTDAADKKRLADSAMAKRQSQIVNSKVANLASESGKPTAKSLKKQVVND